MMGERLTGQEALFYGFSLEQHVPDDHLLRSIDRFVDLSGVRDHLRDYYSSTGRPSVDPELMIRMLIVGYCFGIRSERRLPAGTLNKLVSFSAEELASMEAAIALLKRENLDEHVESLLSVEQKIRLLLNPKNKLRIEPDLDALLEGEGIAMHPGPRSKASPEVIEQLRRAIVGRHIKWNTWRPDLKEDLAHLVDNIKRRVCFYASAVSPWFSV